LTDVSEAVSEINVSRWTFANVSGTLDSMADLIGYARISPADQSPDLQEDALKKAGCLRVFSDRASGATDQRPELERMLDHLRPGDSVVVWRLDRLARSLRNLIEIVRRLEEKKVGLKSLQESIDTTTSSGKLIFHVFGALAEFERELIRERTRAGLEAARARGRKGGRPSVMTRDKLAAARKLYESGDQTMAQIARSLSVSRSSLYRALQKAA
jgi:DNA invertase Pin-like site-specific DNA recombinase